MAELCPLRKFLVASYLVSLSVKVGMGESLLCSLLLRQLYRFLYLELYRLVHVYYVLLLGSSALLIVHKDEILTPPRNS